MLVASIGCGRTPPATERVTLTYEDLPSVDLSLTVRPDEAVRAASTARGTIDRLGEWFGPFPAREVSLVGRDAVSGASAPGDAIVIETPPLSLARGGTLEAEIVHGLAARFWSGHPASVDRQLAAALALYAAARILDDQFPDAHAVERRYLGGLVPVVLRSVPIAGPDSQVARLRGAPETVRDAFALFTLERYLGWGTLQQALAALAEDRGEPLSTARFLSTVNAVSGRDMTWFVADAFGSAKSYDYGIERLLTGPSTESAGSYSTSVTARRFGDAVFSDTARESGPFHSTGPLEVRVSFADGSVARERWDGREASIEYDYESKSPAVAATIDPERVLWLDRHPANNTQSLQGNRRAALGWAARWAVWLEDSLLSYAFFF
jgi:hypothetical protein